MAIEDNPDVEDICRRTNFQTDRSIKLVVRTCFFSILSLSNTDTAISDTYQNQPKPTTRTTPAQHEHHGGEIPSPPLSPQHSPAGLAPPLRRRNRLRSRRRISHLLPLLLLHQRHAAARLTSLLRRPVTASPNSPSPSTLTSVDPSAQPPPSPPSAPPPSPTIPAPPPPRPKTTTGSTPPAPSGRKRGTPSTAGPTSWLRSSTSVRGVTI